MKKIIAAFLTVILILSLALNITAINAQAASSASTAVFPDVTDISLAREVAVLQMLGVINGDQNGNFVPNGSLTRAAFCKMAVITMGRGDSVALYKNRTIFPDVRAGHWASGYINLAVAGEQKLITGYPNGTFQPDADISYAQAITILMRMLGYADADAGMLWPDGYLALAQDIGLTEGLAFPASDVSITRAQAAHLFCSLLGTTIKDGDSYITKLGTAVDGVVIMQLDVQAVDGTAGAIRTSKGILKSVNGIVPPCILGLRGMLVQNASGKVLTFLPEENQQRTITVAQTSAAWLKDDAGVRYDIPTTAPAYTTSETSTYGAKFIDIAAGMYVTLFYSADGQIDAVYINTSKAESAIVAGADVSSYAEGWLTGGDTGYTIVKNGAPAEYADIRQYDVITYDKAAKILNVNDFRLSGCYESCWPDMTSPSKITVMGHEFPVLPSAIDSLAKYKVGDIVTFLFTNDLQVAGAAAGADGSTAIGIVEPGVTATTATVKLLNGLVLTGNPNLSDDAVKFSGELVIVGSYKPGQLILSRQSGNGTTKDLDLTKGTLGTTAFSPAIKVFERVGSGGVTQIALTDLMQKTIDHSKILYAGDDYTGRIDTLILNDVTGDRYTYGILKLGRVQIGSYPNPDYDPEDSSSPAYKPLYSNTVSVVNSKNTTGTQAVETSMDYQNGAISGITVSADGLELINVITLTKVPNVKRSAFYVRNDVTYLTLNGIEYPVSKNVECYNSLNETWFATLNDARTFSETLTVYYDRAASEGGKIRLVVVS